MKEHPAAHRLEGHAAGDHDEAVDLHLRQCAVCLHHVGELRAAASREQPLDAVSRALRAAGGSVARRRAGRFAAIAGVALASAAAIFFVRRTGAPVDESSPTSLPPSAPGEAIQFKGVVQLAVVRDRSGEQQRFVSNVRVRKGDRLRVEVAVAGERPVMAGVLGKDGSWLVVLGPALLQSGTHFSERAAIVDDPPIEGVVLAGDPTSVQRARSTGNLSGVAQLPVLVEP